MSKGLRKGMWLKSQVLQRRPGHSSLFPLQLISAGSKAIFLNLNQINGFFASPFGFLPFMIRTAKLLTLASKVTGPGPC